MAKIASLVKRSWHPCGGTLSSKLTFWLKIMAQEFPRASFFTTTGSSGMIFQIYADFHWTQTRCVHFSVVFQLLKKKVIRHLVQLLFNGSRELHYQRESREQKEEKMQRIVRHQDVWLPPLQRLVHIFSNFPRKLKIYLFSGHWRVISIPPKLPIAYWHYYLLPTTFNAFLLLRK